jgi:hypothetical protein
MYQLVFQLETCAIVLFEDFQGAGQELLGVACDHLFVSL